MKHLATILAAVLCAVCLTGCGSNNGRESVSAFNSLETVEYKGHSYILYQGYSKGGITHDPELLNEK